MNIKKRPKGTLQSRDLEKDVQERLKWVQEQTRAGINTSLEQMRELGEAVDELAPEFGLKEVNEDHLDLGLLRDGLGE